MTGITNPAEEYFKDGIWGWVTDQWVKLIANSAGHLQVDAYPHGIWGLTGVIQVYAYTQQENAVATLYTVPTGKTFYLTTMYIQAYNNGAGDATGVVWLRNNSSVIITGWRADCLQDQQFNVNLLFNPPFQLPAAYDFRVDSDHAGHYLSCFIAGYTL